jgi:hypothetical protein
MSERPSELEIAKERIARALLGDDERKKAAARALAAKLDLTVKVKDGKVSFGDAVIERTAAEQEEVRDKLGVPPPAETVRKLQRRESGAEESELQAVRSAKRGEEFTTLDEQLWQPKMPAPEAALRSMADVASRGGADEAAGVGAVVAERAAGAPDAATPGVLPSQKQDVPHGQATAGRGVGAPLERVGGSSTPVLDYLASPILAPLQQLGVKVANLAPNAYVEERDRFQAGTERAHAEQPQTAAGAGLTAGLMTAPPVGPLPGSGLAGRLQAMLPAGVQRVPGVPLATRAAEGAATLAPQAAAEGAIVGEMTRQGGSAARAQAEGAGASATTAALMGTAGEALLTPGRHFGARQWGRATRARTGGVEDARRRRTFEAGGGGPVVRELEAPKGDTRFSRFAGSMSGRPPQPAQSESGLKASPRVVALVERAETRAASGTGDTDVKRNIATEVGGRVNRSVRGIHQRALSRMKADKDRYFATPEGATQTTDMQDILAIAQEQLARRRALDGTDLDSTSTRQIEGWLDDLRGAPNDLGGGMVIYDPKELDARQLDDARKWWADKAEEETHSEGSKAVARSIVQGIRKKIQGEYPELHRVNEEAAEVLGPLNDAMKAAGFGKKPSRLETRPVSEDWAAAAAIAEKYAKGNLTTEAANSLLAERAPRTVELLKRGAAARDWLDLIEGADSTVRGTGRAGGATFFWTPGQQLTNRIAGLKNVEPGVPGRRITTTLSNMQLLEQMLGDDE